MENRPASTFDGVVAQPAPPKPASFGAELVGHIPVRLPNQPGQAPSQQLSTAQPVQPKAEPSPKAQQQAAKSPDQPKTESIKITAISLAAVAVASGLIYLVFRA